MKCRFTSLQCRSDFCSDLFIACAIHLLEFAPLLFGQFVGTNLLNLSLNISVIESVCNNNSHLFPSLWLTLLLVAANLSQNHDEFLKLFVVCTQESLWIFKHAVCHEIVLFNSFFHVMGKWHQIHPNTW